MSVIANGWVQLVDEKTRFENTARGPESTAKLRNIGENFEQLASDLEDSGNLLKELNRELCNSILFIFIINFEIIFRSIH